MRKENISEEKILEEGVQQDQGLLKNSSRKNMAQFSERLQKSVIEVQQKYGDILNLPHHVSETHPPMPIGDRAAQFAPFAALTGYKEAIEETERLTDRKIVLDEESREILDQRISEIQHAVSRKEVITVTYFVEDKKKEGGAYHRISGKLKKIDTYERYLIMEEGERIKLEDVVEII